jgi:hypothetical protein
MTRVAAGKTVRVPLTVTDARGTGAGWTLKLTSSLPVSIASVSVACGPRSTCTLPRATRAASGNIVLRAAPRSGLGVFRLVVKLVPAARSSASRVTFSID